MVGLVGALDRHADVGRLVGPQLGELGAERTEVQAGDLLVEVLGQHVDLLLVLVVLGPQLDLGDRLVGERVRHHERRVAGRVAEVQQPALGQQDDRVAVGELPLVDLRLDVDPLRDLAQAGDVDLVVEVADVADDRVVLHPRHLLGADDVLVAGGRDEHVAVGEHVLERLDAVALHARLQRADRVDLGDGHAGALGLQRGGGALAHVAVAADHGVLAGEHHVGRAEDAVDQRVAAAVEVVELRLGDRVVHVDRREQQLAVLRELVEAMHAGGGLLGHALDGLADLGVALRVLGERALEQAQEHLELLGLGVGGVRARRRPSRTRCPCG